MQLTGLFFNRNLRRATALGVGLFGALILGGWLTQTEGLKGGLASNDPIRPMTAILFIAAGIGLATSPPPREQRPSPFLQHLTHALAFGLVIGLTGATLIESFTGRGLGVEQLPVLFDSSGRSTAGLIPPNTALAFLLLGIGNFLVRWERLFWCFQAVVLMAGLIAFLALVGYAYGIRSFYGLTFYADMALPTAVIALLLSIVSLTLKPDRGVIALFTSPTPGGYWLRFWFVVIVIVQLGMAWLGLAGHRQGLYRFESAFALLASANLIIFLFFAWWTGQSLNRSDAKRRIAERRVAQLNRLLRERITELETLLHVCPIGIAVAHDAECRRVSGNPALHSMVGQIGHPSRNPEAPPPTNGPDDEPPPPESMIALMNTAIESNGPITGKELSFHRASGQDLFLFGCAAPLHDEDRKIRGCLGLFADISPLKESEQQVRNLAAIVESSDDAIISSTMDGIILNWNEAATRLYGYTSTEAIGKPIDFIVPPERRGELHRHLESLTRHESIRPFETERIRKDGQRISVSLTLSPIRDSGGRLTAAATIERDITERKRAEEAILQSQREFRRLADAMPQMVWTADERGTPTYFNERWAEYTGKSASEPPEDWTRWVHPEDTARTRERFHQALSRGIPFESECRLLRFDGLYRWHLARALPLWSSKTRTLAWYGTFTDVDEQKRDKEQIFRLNETLLSVLKVFPDIVFVVNTGGDLELSNPPADEFLSSLGTENTLPEWLKPELQEVLRTGQSHLPTTFSGARCVSLHQRDIYLLPRIVAMGDPRDHMLGAVVLLQDITEFRLLDEVKTNLLGTVSHELKTPVTSIRMSLLLLLEQGCGTLNAQQQELVTIACDESERLLQTLNTLLDLTRFEEGLHEIHREYASASDLVHAAVKTAGHRAEQAAVTIRVDLEQDLPSLLVDRDRLVHALENLLTNAIKYSPQDGEVRVRVALEDGYVRFRIRDNGPGIPERHQKRIFDKFFRVPGTPKSGSGLGLAIVREFIHAHGGAVHVQSREGEGAEFSFTLPIENKRA